MKNSLFETTFIKLINQPDDQYLIKIKSLLEQAFEHYGSNDDLHQYHNLLLDLHHHINKEIDSFEK